MAITYRRASVGDERTLAQLAIKVYHATEEEMVEEYSSSLRKASWAMFLAEDEGKPIGFMDASIRPGYVNGADDEPVAFCEGVFVEEGYRRNGVARRLLKEAEKWASEQGARTFASDRELDNELSGIWHEGVGFGETERVVYYAKPNEPSGPRYDEEFWHKLDALVAEHEIVIDRPKGSAHPRYPSLIYPLDYGYLKDTASMDGDGIDVWLGSAGDRKLDAIIVTVDLFKKDSEIKLLLGCTAEDKQTILKMLNERMMSAILVERD